MLLFSSWGVPAPETIQLAPAMMPSGMMSKRELFNRPNWCRDDTSLYKVFRLPVVFPIVIYISVCNQVSAGMSTQP